jgi:F-type H+-transporting ATPase subunit a
MITAATTYEDKIAHMFDWNMDSAMYGSLFVMAIVLIIAIIFGVRARIGLRRKEYLQRPHGVLMVGEWYCEFCQKFATSKMGDNFIDMGGYFMTLFAYLFLAFNWGLTGMTSVIDWLAAPLCLSIIMFTLIQVQAIKTNHWHYFHRYIEPIALFLPINLVTMWTPIISTSMRLFGNCLSGTIIMALLQWALGKASAGIWSAMGVTGQVVGWSDYFNGLTSSPTFTWTSIFLAPIPMGILNLYFSLFSAFVQTTVFSTLTALWIAQEAPAQESPSLTAEAPRVQTQG